MRLLRINIYIYIYVSFTCQGSANLEFRPVNEPIISTILVRLLSVSSMSQATLATRLPVKDALMP